MPNLAFTDLLKTVQEYVSERYAAALVSAEKFDQIKPYVTKFIRENGYFVTGMTTEELVDGLYSEMVEYSFLTPFLSRDDVEEININGWDDVAITYTSGRIVKDKKFFSPQHAIDVVKRLLSHSGIIIDDATPMAQGHLPNNTRITALKMPLVDADRGIAVSIRILHPSRVTRNEMIARDTATAKMIDFMCMLLRYGVSFVVAGATSSGKTTLLNAILTSIPEEKRIFTIESGARELSLVRRDRDGEIINNVVHTLSRPSDNEANNVSQEDLVVASLRFNPDVVVVGEMRDVEAYSAVEAA